MTMIQSQPPKKPLGKGLSALLNQNTILSRVRGLENSSFIEVPLNQIEPNPYQPRREFLGPELQELKESIATYGIIQPIILRRKGGKYQIIAGERRWQASRLLNLTVIPAVIKDVNDQETFEIALIENIQRQNLNILEEAQAYEKMISEYKYTHDLLSKRMGKSRSHITNSIRLLSLPEAIKKLIATQQISAGHARSLINADNPEDLAKKIVNEHWSVRRTENEIKRLQSLKRGKEKNANPSNFNRLPATMPPSENGDLGEIEQMLRHSLSMPVRINDSPKGGQVIIEYTSLEELDVVIRKLSADVGSF